MAHDADATHATALLARNSGAIVEATTLHTLLDEWLWRRDALSLSPGGDAQLVNAQLRVLEYLINRYRDAPEAQRPAPARPAPELQVNHRAIVVLHHIWNGRVGGIKSSHEAKNRMTAILERMRSHAAGDESEKPAAVDPSDDAAIDPAVWSSISARACRGRHLKNEVVAGALVKNPCMPHAVTLELYERIVQPDVDDAEAAQLLVQGRNRLALNYILYAWQYLTGAGRKNRAWKVLNRFLATPQPTAVIIQWIRESLAHDNARIRMAAIDVLGQIGALEDIGLLNDLLALPVAADEHPDERNALIRAMWTISKASRSV
jgi:hypothetical protein